MILEKAVPQSLEILRKHLVVCGDIKFSALNDDNLQLQYIWPGSVAPADDLPPDEETTGQPSNQLYAARYQKVPLDYSGRLTETQHLTKALHLFEDEALSLQHEQDRVRLRPDAQTWAKYRAIIVHWDQSIRKACKHDLEHLFDDIEKSVL